MKKVFIAYPGDPSVIGTTIEQAKSDANAYGPGLEVTTWRREDLGGQPLTAPILESIATSDVIACDITRLNFNVTYEMGYSIGLGKRALPVINNSLQYDINQLHLVGIYDTLIYQTYATSQGLIEHVTGAEPGRRLATSFPVDPLPLYIVLPPIQTDDTNKILTFAARAGLRPRKFDPSEEVRLSAITAVRSVASSNGVVLPLLDSQMKDAQIHNMRVAFVAGLAHALSKPTLILQRGVWPTPLDIRDEVKSYSNDEQLGIIFAEFAPRVHEHRYSSHLPLPGPANKLAAINLGDPAAENEETLLPNYFLERVEFRQVLDGRANIVVGRKGSGKSAVFYQTRDRLSSSRANIILALSPEAYQLRKLKDLVLRCLAAGSKEFLLSAFWEYVLLLEICAKILEKDRDVHKRNHTLFEPYQRLLACYTKETSSEGISFSDRLVRLIDRMATSYRDRFGDRTNVDLSDGQVTEILYQTTLSSLRTELVQYIKNKEKTFLLFDNIDKAWNANGLDDSDIVMIRTLLDANRKIGNDFRRSGGEYYSAVFLRNDVYDLLLHQTPDRGKETTVLLDWVQPDLLRQFVRRRLQFNSSEGSQTIENLWHKFCVPVLNGEDSLQYLISRSLMRPRFLLRLINYCKGSAINFGRDRIDERDIADGLSLYSTDILTDIGLEIRDVLPSTDGILYAFLREKREMRKTQVMALLTKKLGDDVEADAAFNLLLWHGVSGYRRSASEVTYIYDVNYDIRRLRGLLEKSGTDPMIQMNPAFWTGLEMT